MKHLLVFTLAAFLGLSGFSQKTEKMIKGKWVHSYEESTNDGSKIYRPIDYKEWPPSRFRQQFEFFAEGKCKYMWLAPNDRHQMLDGTYKMDSDNTFILIYDIDGKELYKIEILALEKNLLKVIH